MEELRPPVRCPRCNALPRWDEVRPLATDRAAGRPDDPPGRLGTHQIIGWTCSNCGYFLASSQWES